MTKNGAVTFRSDTSDRKATVAVGPMTIRAMCATTDGSSIIAVSLFHFDGTDERQIGVVSVPTSAGVVLGEPSVDLLSEVSSPWVQVDENGNNVIRLGEHETLRVGITSVLSGGKRLDVVAFGDDE